MKTDNGPPRGTRDLLPATVARRDQVMEKIHDVYRRFGYQRIETPCLEDIGRLQSGEGGENEKLIFRILRRGLGDGLESGATLSTLVDLGLRFDLTVPLARFFGHNQANLALPFRSFQAGPVWRAERPQRGRYRQLTQCDIDILGEGSILAEAELIEATTEALGAVGLSGTTLRLSDRRILGALAERAGITGPAVSGFFISLDKLDKVGWDEVRSELVSRGLPLAAIERAAGAIEALRGLVPSEVPTRLANAIPNLADDVISDLAGTAACLDALASPSTFEWEFDPTLVRGMGYYTGQIFEINHPSTPLSIAGGGRYDRLIGRSLGQDVPACGFSIGFERIMDLVEDADRSPTAAVLYEPEIPLPNALRLARDLRAEGRDAVVLRRHGALGKQLRRLEEWGFTSFVHIRPDQLPGATVEERPLGQRTSGAAGSSS